MVVKIPLIAFCLFLIFPKRNSNLKKLSWITAQKTDQLNKLEKNLLEPLEHDSVGGVVPKIYFEKGYEFHKDRYKESDKGKVIWYAGGKMDWENVYTKHKGVDEVDNGQFDRIEEVDFATGCALFTSAQVISEMKGFDNRYFLYFEDSDLSQRLKKAGYKILFYPKAILWHKNAGSTGGSGSSLQDYF